MEVIVKLKHLPACVKLYLDRALWLFFGATLAFSYPSKSFAQSLPLTYDGVVSLIQTQHVNSIEELLPLLPTPFRSSYTLVRDSMSMQASDALHPRVILYGQDAKLLMAFNGNSSQHGFDSLEMIQFRDDLAAFQMHLIEFPSAQNGLTAPRFSGPNPKACLGCHGTDPRPNWESYSDWPGMYGANDDRLNSDEEKSYAIFRKNRLSDPRYGALIPPGQYDQSPFSPSQSSVSYDRNERTNLKLTKFINRLNSKRLARMLLTVPTADQMRIEMSLLGCSPTANVSSQAAAPFQPLEKMLDSLGITPQIWTPAFRRFIPASDESQPAHYSGDYAYEDGTGDLKDLVASATVVDWNQAGDQEIGKLISFDEQTVSGDRGDLDAIFNAMGKRVSYGAAHAICSVLQDRLK
jgi:hypothetical protein